MVGETVEVETTVQAGKDSFGNAIYESKFVPVENVLVAPSSTTNVIDTTRPNGANVVYQLYFPKGFDLPLMNKKIKVRNEVFRVIGDPKPYPVENTPTPWFMEVEVEHVEG